MESPPALLCWAARDALTIRQGLGRATRRLSIAVSGRVTAEEALTLGLVLDRCVDADTGVRDLPWAAVVRREDGSVRATCSTMYAGGLFYRVLDGRSLIVSSDPRSAATAGGDRATLNADFLRDFAAGSADPFATVYDCVRRLPAGYTLDWRVGDHSATLTQWCGPETLPKPGLDDPEHIRDVYLSAFDRVNAGLAERTDEVLATVSGGLDSGFMAASLARVRAVRGYCHSPLPEARAQPLGPYDPDDLPLARHLEQMYPGRIGIEPLRNTDRVHPLDAAAEASARSGWPVFSPANAIWLNQFAQIARDERVPLRFHAGQGNPGFSADHEYSARYYARRPLALYSLLHGRSPESSARSGMRRRILRPLFGRVPQRPPLFLWPDHVPPTQRLDRDGYLRWLCAQRSSLPTAFNSAGTAPALVADPFAARSMIEIAAAIEPRQWQFGDDSRSLARRLAVGRLPDSIRLRRRRGGQGLDAWFVVANSPERLDRGLQVLADDPMWREVVDVDAMLAWWSQARQQGPFAPPDAARLDQTLRIVALAEFHDGCR